VDGQDSMASSSESTPAYGTDEYWQTRYCADGHDEDQTNEWLLSWEQLSPLITSSLTGDANTALLDLGCGTSTLALDVVEALPEARVTAVDVAPAAVEAQRKAAKGINARVEFLCLDASERHVWRAAMGSRRFDVVVDKSTTDGLLCDTRRGPKRVHQMYTNIGANLASRALVVVVSWRDPQDGLEWLSSVIGGLQQQQQQQQQLPGVATEQDKDTPSMDASWSLDVHSIVRRAGKQSARGPHVYLVRRCPRRRSLRLAAQRGSASATRTAAAASGEEDGLVMRLHVHEVPTDE
jgi:SAM-dependent methyltransferase